MRKSQFIFVLMLGCSFATMARADDDGTSLANCLAAKEGNCEQIGTSGTYYALSGDEGNQTMTIYGTKGSESNAATVPDYAFEENFPAGITSLKTSGNVNIGIGAFSYATGLTSVDLTGVQSIGEGAFRGATGLTSANLTGVQTIGNNAFNGATGLTSIDLTGVQTIEERIFSGATGLTSIVISDSFLGSNGNILGYAQRDDVYTGIHPLAFINSGLSTIYCPKGKTCSNSFLGVTPTIISYSKNDDGTYSVGENMYANADMMTKNFACENADQCAALRTALDAGGTCSTQDACNTLALQYATPQPTKPQRADIRIYTIEEANLVAKPTGNTVRIKYR